MVSIKMVFIKILIEDNKYNPNGFDINGKNKDTNDLFNSNGFNVNGIQKDTDDIYMILMVLI